MFFFVFVLFFYSFWPDDGFLHLHQCHFCNAYWEFWTPGTNSRSYISHIYHEMKSDTTLHETAYQSTAKLFLSQWKWEDYVKKKNCDNSCNIYAQADELKLKIYASITSWLLYFTFIKYMHRGKSTKIVLPSNCICIPTFYLMKNFQYSKLQTWRRHKDWHCGKLKKTFLNVSKSLYTIGHFFLQIKKYLT